MKEKQYRIIRKLGKGAFGVVYQGRWKETNELLAVKETLQDPRFVNREGDISKMMQHENVVKFYDVKYEHRQGKKYLILIMEYYPQSLQDLIDMMVKVKRQFSPSVFQKISLSIFSGLAHIHSKGIAHRDIKPDNILVNLNERKVAIADLGSAKPINDGSYNKSYICSRIYRAPELVLGCQTYTYRIDMWSAGCVLMEMLLLTPLFPARGNDHLLELMQKLLGKLDEEDMNKLREGNIQGEAIEIQEMTLMKHMLKVAEHCGEILTPKLMNLLKQTLQWDPQTRLNSKDALNHNYFANREF